MSSIFSAERFLSGALFPPRPEMWTPLRWVMQLNPLTYGLAGLRRAMYLGDANADAGMPGLGSGFPSPANWLNAGRSASSF